jgi:zinc transport system substrate-binding protein
MASASGFRWRIISVIAVVAAILVIVVALPRGPQIRPAGKIQIVCTFLPNYVFTRNVVGQSPEVGVRLLLPRNVGCPHNYVITPADLKAVAQADIIVANGLGLELFLDDLLRTNPKARLITISDDCDVLEARSPDPHKHGEHGHTATEHEHEGEEDEGHERGEHDKHDEPTASQPSHADEHPDHELNPHVWVSPVQAMRQIRSLARQLAEADPDRAAVYKANSEAYITRIESLHRRMVEASAGFANRRIVTFHDAFAYLARDLNLEVAATLTIDPTTPPSAQAMASVIETIRQGKVGAIFYEPAYSDSTARTISRDTGVPAFPLNPLNSLDVEPGDRSYEDVMETNLEVLKKALGPKP